LVQVLGSIIEVEFYRKEFVNLKKKVTNKSSFSKSRYSFASKYTIDDEKALNIAKGKAAFYPKKR
jgi:hypothetical protein